MAPNPACYFEIPVTDLDRAIKFYGDVFGYQFTQQTIHGNKMAFFPFDEEQEGISGALAKGETYKPSKEGGLIYLHTQSIDQTVNKIKSCGGNVLFPKTSIEGYGFVAEFQDSEGNRLALFEEI